MTLPDTPATSASKQQLDDARLRDYALSYLARFPVSSQRMRIVLARRAQAKEQNLTSQGLVELLAELQELGYLNDEKFARARASSLLRRGASLYEIRAKLGRDGVNSAQIQETLAQVIAQDAEQRDSAENGREGLELLQALKVARKRRLGPFRYQTQDPQDNKAKQKEMMALARKGFSLVVIKRLFNASEEELLAWQKQAEEQG